MNWEVVRLCKEYDAGVLQMPCPEMEFLGLRRERPPGKSIREALDTAEGRECCRKISVNIAHKVKEYLCQGYQLLAILGGNPESPGCAVHAGRSGLLPKSGVFMRQLQVELRNHSIEVPFRGIRDFDSDMMAEDIRWLEMVFSKVKA
jgi:predicted secreted protein